MFGKGSERPRILFILLFPMDFSAASKAIKLGSNTDYFKSMELLQCGSTIVQYLAVVAPWCASFYHGVATVVYFGTTVVRNGGSTVPW